MKRTSLAGLAVLAAASAALAATPVAAAAPPSTTAARTAGGQAWAEWTEVDTADALRLPGNTHVGYLGVYQQPGYTDVYGWVHDYECAAGQAPPSGHGDAGSCADVGTRFLSADPGAAVFAADARGGTASLTGTLTVSNGGHGEPGSVLARPPVDVRWTSGGGARSFTRTERWSDGTNTYSSRVRGTAFDAAVSGRIGPMDFTDDADDTSTGGAESWRETSRSRTRG
jgi:hypothetical protein